jgi:hypothetical protein
LNDEIKGKCNQRSRTVKLEDLLSVLGIFPPEHHPRFEKSNAHTDASRKRQVEKQSLNKLHVPKNSRKYEWLLE